jgi:sulfide:quinone oxidoreductase
MAHIVILGAGIGGMPAAYEMSEILRPGDKLTVISNNANHRIRGSPSIGANATTVELEIEPLLEEAQDRIHRHRRQARASGREPDRTRRWPPHRLRLPGHRHRSQARLRRDRRAWARGIPSRSATSTTRCTRRASGLAGICQDPGPIVVGAVQGASCFGPAYEFAMIMETDLRRRKIRDKVPMTFVTPSPISGTSASAASATRRA